MLVNSATNIKVAVSISYLIGVFIGGVVPTFFLARSGQFLEVVLPGNAVEKAGLLATIEDLNQIGIEILENVDYVTAVIHG